MASDGLFDSDHGMSPISETSSANSPTTVNYADSSTDMYSSLNSSMVSDGLFDSDHGMSPISETSSANSFYENDTKLDRNLKVYYTNADSLLNKFNELCVAVSLIDPDIVVITEVFPKNCNPLDIHCNEYKLPGFNCFKGNVTSHSRGVVIYIKENIPADESKFMGNLPFKESTWCELRINSNEKLLLGAIYKSPNSDQQNHEHLLSMLSQDYLKEFKNVIVVGDFNFPGIDWENYTTTHSENHVTFKFIETLRDNFMHQHVNEHTRCRLGQAPSLLDLVLSNNEELIDNLRIGDKLGASDHNCITFEIICSCPVRHNARPRKQFFKGDYDKCRKYLGEIDWSVIDNMASEEAWIFFKDKINYCIDNFIPTKKSKFFRPKPRWMDHYCVRAVKKKYHAWKRFTFSRSYSDYETYCKLRNQVTKAVYFSKKKHEKGVAQGAKLNPKSFWGYVKEKTKSRSGVSDLINTNGDSVTEDSEKAELLNSFFTSVFTREADGTLPLFEDRVDPENYVTNVTLTPEIVLKHLNALNPSKSCGPDDCHPMLLKQCASVLCTPLHTIYCKSLEHGILPMDWKVANVSCIFKKGKRSDPGNYRPVSLTSIVCKVLEKCVRQTLLEHMKQHNLFTDDQFGFRNHRSTTLQLLTVLDDWTSALDKGSQVDAIYLDFAKAFDTVPHSRLLHKLKSYGISGKLLLWIENFLKDRKQRVLVNGSASTWSNVISGIPQGSILGPILFIIYINDIPELLQSTCKLFADDTKLYKVISNCNDQSKLQSDLYSLCQWSKDWLLRFNVKKCKVLQVGSVKFNFDYQMFDKSDVYSSLSIDDSERDLGIHFTNTLNFDVHVNKAVNKANSLIGLIRRNFTYMDSKLFLLLYKALIRPHLDYGNIIWFPTLKKNKRIIENVQRRATRMIPDLKGLSYEERLSRLNLPTLEYRRKRGDLIQLFKIIHRIDDIDCNSLFSFSDNQGRGHCLKLQKPRANKSVKLNSYTHRVINSWNDLPENIVTRNKVIEFKTQLDIHWSSSRYDTSDIY